jgi:hypothetical protein
MSFIDKEMECACQMVIGEVVFLLSQQGNGNRAKDATDTEYNRDLRAGLPTGRG